jgi:hypothetical protein
MLGQHEEEWRSEAKYALSGITLLIARPTATAPVSTTTELNSSIGGTSVPTQQMKQDLRDAPETLEVDNTVIRLLVSVCHPRSSSVVRTSGPRSSPTTSTRCSRRRCERCSNYMKAEGELVPREKFIAHLRRWPALRQPGRVPLRGPRERLRVDILPDLPVEEDTVRQIYDLMKWGPTSANSRPARPVLRQ